MKFTVYSFARLLPCRQQLGWVHGRRLTLSSLSWDHTLRDDQPTLEYIRSPFAYSLLLQAINLAFLTSPKLTHHKVQPVL